MVSQYLDKLGNFNIDASIDDNDDDTTTVIQGNVSLSMERQELCSEESRWSPISDVTYVSSPVLFVILNFKNNMLRIYSLIDPNLGTTFGTVIPLVALP